MRRKTKAIVLQRRPFAEYDELVSFYTLEYGKLIARARGVKKPATKMGRFLHIPAELECSFVEGRSQLILAGVVPLRYFRNIFHSLPALYYIEKFFSRADLFLPEGEEDKNLYTFLKRVLEEADHKEEKEAKFWRKEKHWLWQLLHFLGAEPQEEQLNLLSPSAVIQLRSRRGSPSLDTRTEIDLWLEKQFNNLAF